MRLLAFALATLVASPAGALPRRNAASAVAAITALHADAGAETGTGFLDVSSDPPAKILIDDTDTGKVTPQPHLELKVGHHKLTLVRLDGGHSRSLGFTIAAGQTRKFTLHLAP
jgi:hypothetical protein